MLDRADRLTSKRDGRYLSALATALRGTALPYGYTLTVWTSGMMLTNERGLPSVGDVFLFMIGAVAGFVVLGLIVRLTGTAPFDPSFGDLWRTGMIQLVVVGGGGRRGDTRRPHPQRHRVAVRRLRRDGGLPGTRDA